MDEEIRKAEKGAALVQDTIIGLLVLVGIFILSHLVWGYPSLLWVFAPIWLPIGIILGAIFALGLFYLTLIILYNVAEWLKKLGQKKQD